MIEGRLGYNSSNDRYGVLVSDLWEDNGLHCGECLEILVDDCWISSRIEMKWTNEGNYWYLVGTPYYGNLEYVRVRI
ncbi:MAG: DUF5348 domain-containing protein [Lachnospiraceae bacterium]|nr:DUF5348 domain-containing protein [Lachnospiraceae bacterium]